MELYTKEKKFKSILLETFGNSPRVRIIDFFMDNPKFEFTKSEVMEALGMCKRTFYKHFRDVKAQGIVIVSGRRGRAKLYKLNLEHPLVRLLMQYELQVSLQYAKKEAEKEKVSAEI